MIPDPGPRRLLLIADEPLRSVWRELLPADVAILTGGRGMPAYQDAIKKIGAVQIGDLSDLAGKLEALRKPAIKISVQKQAAK